MDALGTDYRAKDFRITISSIRRLRSREERPGETGACTPSVAKICIVKIREKGLDVPETVSPTVTAPSSSSSFSRFVIRLFLLSPL